MYFIVHVVYVYGLYYIPVTEIYLMTSVIEIF